MIYLYGPLRKQYGDVINCNVNSAAELMKAAEALRPGFKDRIQKDRKYVIRRGTDFRKAKSIDEEEVEMRFGETDWHIVPMPVGYGGVVKVILGVVLLVVAYVAPYTAWITAPMGLALLSGGVADLLAPAPSVSDYGSRDSPAERASFLFNGPTNRIAPGGAVPIIYGFNVFVGSIFLSGGLEVGDVST